MASVAEVKPTSESGDALAKRLMAVDVRLPENRTQAREQLVLFFADMAKRASTMAPQDVEHVTRALVTLNWPRPITDDVVRAACCGAEQLRPDPDEQSHFEKCPVRFRLGGRS